MYLIDLFRPASCFLILIIKIILNSYVPRLLLFLIVSVKNACAYIQLPLKWIILNNGWGLKSLLGNNSKHASEGFNL